MWRLIQPQDLVTWPLLLLLLLPVRKTRRWLTCWCRRRGTAWSTCSSCTRSPGPCWEISSWPPGLSGTCEVWSRWRLDPCDTSRGRSHYRDAELRSRSSEAVECRACDKPIVQKKLLERILLMWLHFLANYNNENLPNRKKDLPKQVQNVSKWHDN